MSNPNVLPDSRLKDPKGTVMVDWGTATGETVRLELEPIFCFNCGKPNGYVPRDIMSFVSWLCQPCSDRWGHDASLHVHADQEFWDKVGHEMQTRYGRALTQLELWALAEADRLPEAMKLLIRESPYTE